MQNVINTKAQIRTKSGSVSDMHILYCDCSHCDGVGELMDPFSFTGMECPACEGMGYLEPAAQQAYTTYLNDLYREKVRVMPGAPRKPAVATSQTFHPAA